MSCVLFSVVTVCFNAENEIEDTMNSVLTQKCKDYEYLVIDGKSTDGTFQKVSLKKPCFLENGIGFSAISEKDNGIYHAMNKAVILAKGEYIVFINAGDQFYSDNTLEELKSFLQCNECDIVIGDIIIKYRGLYRYKKAVFHGLNCQIDVCHQSTYTRTSLLKERNYDESYRLAADRDFLCYAVSRGYRVSVLHKPLSIYLEGGASATNQGRDEIKQIDAKYGIPNVSEKSKISDQSSEGIIKKMIIKLHGCVPHTILKRRQRKQMLNAGWSPVIPSEEE